MKFLLCLVLLGVLCCMVYSKRRTCSLPKKTGPCRAAFRRYYYDSNSKACKRFIYGGCRGNGNNFRSLKECHKRCSGNSDSENQERGMCSLPKKTGPCRAAFRRYYYDSNSKACKRFIYGGCRGNRNNFRSLKKCHKRCSGNSDSENQVDACKQPRKTGPCRGYMRRFYYDQKSRSCIFFIYGGCKGNDNNFKTLKQCNLKCNANTADICRRPRKPGPCRGSMKRYHYDHKTGRCNEFIYGGCKGNENNFRSMRECQLRCSKYQGDICVLPKKPGICKGYFLRYYYDEKTGFCEKFIYGGCRGNPNNFNSWEECESYCDPDIVDQCTLPYEVGNCRASIRRYYFNYATKKCEKFYYGGCGGNTNNFETIEDCRRVCDHHLENTCNLPKVTGLCKAYFKRYYYNIEKKSCEEFIYGGCGGNRNNFKSYNACQDECEH